MGTFTVTMRVSDLAGRRSRDVAALVDTGASHTVFPRDVLEELGVEPRRKEPFQLADDRTVEHDVGDALIRLNGKEGIAPVVFGEPRGPVLLGATTLEIFNLGVDPIRKRLIPIRGLLMCL